MTTVLPNTKLYFHDALWSVPWDDIISERNGESKRLLEVMKKMGHILEPCQHWDATPCAMAWLLLWSRNFGIAQSGLALLECDLHVTGGGQLRTLEMLWRQATELQLDLMVIANPGEASFGEIDPEKAGEVYARLCGYLAYCANNESRYYIKMYEKDVLDTVDDLMDSERKLLSETSKYSNLVKKLQKELWADEVENDGPTQVPRRAERREFAKEQKNRLRRWLQHEDLVQWDDEIRNRVAEKYFVKNFPDLVVPGASVRNTLGKYEMEFGYLPYQRASALVHGSHIGSFLEDWGEGFIPSVIESPDNLEREAAHVRRFTHNNAVRLHNLREWIAEFCVAG